jgi:hypothetical protein
VQRGKNGANNSMAKELGRRRLVNHPALTDLLKLLEIYTVTKAARLNCLELPHPKQFMAAHGFTHKFIGTGNRPATAEQ